MAYEPLRSELTAEEAQFLARLAPLGLDWESTRQDFARQFGISRYFDWADVVALPASSVLCDAPLVLNMYARPGTMDLPPEYLFAPFMPHDDARRNHSEIEAQLRARLGDPVTADVSNCLIRTWTFGLFAVELHTYPPELQPEYMTRSNELHRKNPRLATASSVTVKSDYAYACPDGSLASVAELVNAGGAHDLSNVRLAHRSYRYTRRNPKSLIAAIAAVGRPELAVWSDPTGRIGVSAPTDSFVFPRAAARRLILTHVHPARGSGGSSLKLELAETSAAPGKIDDPSLFRGDKMDSLDAAAQALSEWWALPLVHETVLDD